MKQNPPVERWQESGQRAQQGRLAHTVASQQAGEAAAVYRRVEVGGYDTACFPLFVADGQMLKANGFLHAGKDKLKAANRKIVFLQFILNDVSRGAMSLPFQLIFRKFAIYI